MSEVTESPTATAADVDPAIESTDLQLPDEKSLLMQRARLMGVPFSNNVTIEKLKAKIAAHLEGEKPLTAKSQDSSGPAVPPAMAENAPQEKLTKQQFRRKLIQEKTKLVRLRIQNLDPKKKDLPGEIYTIANKYIGTIKKYVPFGEATENGYHVPHCIYEMLKAKRFLNIRTLGKGIKARVITTWEREFALEVLPQLTRDELTKLAAAQASSSRSQDE